MFSRQLLPRIQMPRFRRALAAFYVFQTPFKHLFWIDLSYCDIQSLTMHHMRARHGPWRLSRCRASSLLTFGPWNQPKVVRYRFSVSMPCPKIQSPSKESKRDELEVNFWIVLNLRCCDVRLDAKGSKKALRGRQLSMERRSLRNSLLCFPRQDQLSSLQSAFASLRLNFVLFCASAYGQMLHKWSRAFGDIQISTI